MYKPTRSDSYPKPLRLTECLLSKPQRLRVGIASGSTINNSYNSNRATIVLWK